MFIRIWHKKVDLSIQCRMYISAHKGLSMDKIGTIHVPIPEWEGFKRTLTGPVDFIDDL